ncbi:predicted protein [Uncinocarpus reesii 1704]|uniref:DUF676 domain-containing protein n=1 Tax=Uncinocarpus reesii (strain UAMH 1704) TaxID=336963 RepID=C4JF40_UNCRE|nr:uncharacterized protein UREG_00941 [Uncinocarpus reesii 1704]EEP76093.1 predicted protein [Uncinocarpus reesii 1704]
MEESQQIFGIHRLYHPLDQPAEVDIVAVHGPNGHAVKTWTSENICWLSHPAFLPKYVKNARVLAWGYNANLTTFRGQNPSANHILHYAQTLVAELDADREAIAYAASRVGPKLSNVHSIYTCTYGILFFGTPHHGTDRSRFVSRLQRLASLALPKQVMDLNSALLNALQTESEVLRNINDQFIPLLHNFRIYFFWEQEKLNLRFTRDFMVDVHSAAPIIDNTERCGMSADHWEMCRFNSNTSQGFRTAVAALKRYCQQAPRVIGERHTRRLTVVQDNRVHEAMELLKTIQPSESSDTPRYPQLGFTLANEICTQSHVESDKAGSHRG